MESGRPHDLSVLCVDGDQGSAGFQRLLKKSSKNVLFVTIVDWMYERIRSYGVQFMKIVSSKWLEFEEPAFKIGWRSKGILDFVIKWPADFGDLVCSRFSLEFKPTQRPVREDQRSYF